METVREVEFIFEPQVDLYLEGPREDGRSLVIGVLRPMLPLPA